MDEDLEAQTLKEIKKHNLTVEEAKRVLDQLNRPEKVRKIYDHYANSKKNTFGIVSDLHVGSKYFDYHAFEHSVKVFNKSVDAIYIPGDIIEGMSNRDGHIYELEKVGTSAQINLAVDLLNHYKKPIFFTTGNHDEWAKKKANQGVDVGISIQNRVKESEYLGEYTADVKLGKNVIMRLTHDGNTAYALSYSLQKRINAISGGDKPDVLLNGHLHKLLYMFYRNIHAIECGTLQKQTNFMQMIGSPAHVGFLTLDISYNRKGINEISPKFYPHYE